MEDIINVQPSHNNENNHGHNHAGKKNRLAYLLLGIAVVLSGILFLPISTIPSDLIKAFVIGIIMTVAFITYLLPTLKSGHLSLPRGTVFYSMSFATLIAIVSAFSSGFFKHSYWGYGTEAYTAGFLIILLGLFVMAYGLNNDEKKIAKAWNMVYAVIAITSIISIISYIGVASNWFSIAYNPIGFWADFSAILGLGVLISAIYLQFSNLSSKKKIILYVLFALGLIFLILVAIPMSAVWWSFLIVSVFMLAVSMVNFNKVKGAGEWSSKGLVSIPFAVLFVISLLVVIMPLTISNISPKYIQKSIGGNASATWGLTYDMTKSTLKNDPLLGPGPNLFVRNYWVNRPNSINSSAFWNTNLFYGKGTIETFMISTGLLGMIAWLLFLVAILWKSGKGVLKMKDENINLQYSVGAVATLYVVLVLVGYSSSVYLLFLSVFVIAIFLSARNMNKEDRSLVIGQKPLGKLLSIVLSIVFLGFSVLYIYGIGQRLLASTYIMSGVKLVDQKKYDEAEAKILSAAKLTELDIHYRALFELEILKVKELLSVMNSDAEAGKSDELQKKLTTSYQNAIVAGESMIGAWPENMTNYKDLASFYANSAEIKVTGAYDKAKQMYSSAITASPNDPTLYYFMSRLQYTNNDIAGAITSMEKALELKPDVIDFNIGLADLYLINKENDKAIDILVKAIQRISPEQNLVLLERLGTTLYVSKKYNDAIQVFSVILNSVPQYANIKYYLGISLAKVGQFDLAKQAFEDIKLTNPDNKELEEIIKSVTAKRDPFPETVEPVKKATADTKATTTKKK